MATCLHRRGLWFDVENIRDTTSPSNYASTLMLWFDVENIRDTTDISYENKCPGCGLM